MGLCLLGAVTLSLGTTAAVREDVSVCSVSISGPNVLVVGRRIELTAQGSPPGGRYSWLIEPLAPRTFGKLGLLNTKVRGVGYGRRMQLTGLEPSGRPGDVHVTVTYAKDGERCEATWTLTCVAGELTAYRARNGAGYAPFARTPVPDAVEKSPTLGPGIRINRDTDPGPEDDLIEIELDIAPANASFVLWRSTGDLEVWTTPNKTAGTQLAFSAGLTQALPFASGATRLTLWVEWTGPGHGLVDLELRPAGASAAADALRFHSFQSITMALGGENQVPSNPVDPNHGTFVAAIDLYGLGYDVHMYDEDNVSPNGSGAVYNEVVNAVQSRGVAQVVIFGYSHGGGSTYDLSERLDANRAAIGTFSIVYSSYVDGIENDSNFDLDMELRLPPGTAYHVNQYQHGTSADFFLDGGPVPGSNPPPTGLDVETTVWGANATHYIVDDYDEVRDLIQTSLTPRVIR